MHFMDLENLQGQLTKYPIRHETYPGYPMNEMDQEMYDSNGQAQDLMMQYSLNKVAIKNLRKLSDWSRKIRRPYSHKLFTDDLREQLVDYISRKCDFAYSKTDRFAQFETASATRRTAGNN